MWKFWEVLYHNVCGSLFLIFSDFLLENSRHNDNNQTLIGPNLKLMTDQYILLSKFRARHFQFQLWQWKPRVCWCYQFSHGKHLKYSLGGQWRQQLQTNRMCMAQSFPCLKSLMEKHRASRASAGATNYAEQTLFQTCLLKCVRTSWFVPSSSWQNRFGSQVTARCVTFWQCWPIFLWLPEVTLPDNDKLWSRYSFGLDAKL